MKVTYNETKQKFKLIYFDAVKELKGDNYPYSRIQRTWKGDKKPTQRQIKIEIAKLEEEGKVLEKDCAIKAENIKKSENIVIVNEDGLINAVHWFSNLKPESIATKATAKGTFQKVERHIKRFHDFLKQNYALITLDKIKKNHIEEYFKTLSNFCQGEQKAHFTYLKKMFEKVINDNEESTIKYINPLKKLELDDVITPKKKVEKIGFTIDELKSIFNMFVKDEKNKGRFAEQKFGIFYFLAVTGWRISDILNLTWNQVDMEKRTISLTHGKTELKNGHETIIYITPLMKQILERMKENQKLHPFNLQLVFNQRKSARNISKPNKYMEILQSALYPILEDLGIMKVRTNDFNMNFKNYTMHCFRKTLITELTIAEFNEVTINYLVGHANNTVEGKHYLNLKTYPERSTRKMIEHMEQSGDLLYYWEKLINGKDAAQKKLYKLNKWLSPSMIEDMKNNFWSEKAINQLEELYSQGVNMLLIETLIQLCNKVRQDSDESEVTEDMVKDYYQMSKWFNLENIMKEKL
jgi:integrase